jgi:hypothetical protein
MHTVDRLTDPQKVQIDVQLQKCVVADVTELAYYLWTFKIRVPDVQSLYSL